jgi:hypothetical protein
VKELVGGCPAQDQRGRFRCINARWHRGQVAGPERPVGGVRPDHRHIGYPVAELKTVDANAELIDFPDDIIAKDERRSESRSLRVDVTPDRHVGVLHTRGEHADSHLGCAGRRQGGVNYFDHVGIAEAPDLNNPVA